MELNRIYRIATKYECELNKYIIPIRVNSDDSQIEPDYASDQDKALAHVNWMCRKILEMKEGEEERAQRWLGFAQGVLWALGMYSLEDIRKDNRGTNVKG